ncbi:MAG: Holliday junction DNA helicase RuvB C-terminal domain-containing protein, partial [Gloeomargarita sp. DG_2_bins_126]
YTVAELAQIITRTAQLLNMQITALGAETIAQRSRGTPRIANRLLKRVRDYAQIQNVEIITPELAGTALELLAVDPQGLDGVDRTLLTVLIEQFQGGPAGLDTLAAMTGEDPQTIEDVYEPYLMQIGYLQRTPRGRMALPPAWVHLGRTPPAQQLPLL